MKWGVWLCLIAAAAAAAFLLGRVWERRRINRRMRALGVALEGMMRGDYRVDFSSLREGELSILTGQLELAAKRMAGMVDRLSREKGAIKDFIADVSHQLKTPLTALLTYLELLERTEEDPRRREKLEKCVLLAERMHELTRSLLDFARLEADSAVLCLEEHDVTETVRAAARAAQDAQPRPVDFRLEAAGNVPARYDEKWMGQALLNLIKNAMDYAGDPPVVTVGVERTDAAVTVTVRDNGPGVPPEDMPHIFERFYRAKNSPAGGLGIGLPLAREIVRRHHGDVRAVDGEGGAAFAVTLPLLNCVVKTEE